MTPMLPTEPPPTRHLARLAAEFRTALAGSHGPWGLSPVRSAVLVVVDGLGSGNLGESAGHARFLAGRTGRSLLAPVPSTTASSLPTILTGTMPGRHGMVGYRVLDPAHDRVVNELTGWDAGMDPDRWQRSRTIFEQLADAGTRAVAVGPAKFAGSGFTRAVLRGAEYQSAVSVADRVEVALRIVGGREPAFVYLYIPELDKIAHQRGWRSNRWLAALEEVDSSMRRLHERLPSGVAALVTADHGVVDVLHDRHVLYGADPRLTADVRHTGGEPRFLQLYAQPGADIDALAARWRESETERAWVATRHEATEAGWFGDVDAAVAPRIGDVVVAARERVAYYDGSAESTAARRMIAQHGSLTDDERRVPFIRLGAWS